MGEGANAATSHCESRWSKLSQNVLAASETLQLFQEDPSKFDKITLIKNALSAANTHFFFS